MRICRKVILSAILITHSCVPGTAWMFVAPGIVVLGMVAVLTVVVRLRNGRKTRRFVLEPEMMWDASGEVTTSTGSGSDRENVDYNSSVEEMTWEDIDAVGAAAK